MSTKQDAHVHELEIPELMGGGTLETGPPIPTGTEAPDEEGAELELEDLPPETRRAKRGETVPGSVGLAKTIAEEAAASSKALAAGDVNALPPEARKIWDRMYASTKRYQEIQGETDDRYAQGLAWRAIRQNYGLVEPKRAPAAKRLVAPACRKLRAMTVDGVRNGAWIVRLAGDKMADVLYERVEQIPLPSMKGALVTVGHGPGNHRNILNVLVPRRLVSSQAGAVGPIKWVNEHADEIYRVAKASHRYLLTREDRTKRAAFPRTPGLRRLVNFKGFGGRSGSGAAFTTDPRQATKRIAFGENYVPFEVDLQGEYATPDEIESFAHGFMKDLMRGTASPGEMHSRWVMPDGTPAGYPVESFLVRRGDPDFPIPGSWITGTEFHPEVWRKVESGEYRGYSIGGHWGTTPIEGRE